MGSSTVLDPRTATTSVGLLFGWRFADMVAAVVPGMVVTAPVWSGVFWLARCSSELKHGDVYFPRNWAGWMSTGPLLDGGNSLMGPRLLAGMLRRKDEYLQHLRATVAIR